jgi:glycosyltransferase family protein
MNERKRKMNPKISIIVPIYNAEPYLKKCIDSILNQTFKDYELILVNDGSRDRSGKICDDYALQDNRIRVFHKENGGQATARNLAIEVAKGDYIGFIDSDDWIEPDMYELLYQLCIEHECDIANCTTMIYFKNRTLINGEYPLVIHDRFEAMRTMLEGKLYDEVVCTKLIKKELLKNVRFPTGIMYEDTAFTYKVIDNCHKLASLGVPKYHYVKHDNSTMDRAIKYLNTDAVKIYDEMYDFIAKHYPDFTEYVILKLANNAMKILNLISIHSNFNLHKKDYYQVIDILNKYYLETMQIKDYPLNVKLLLTAARAQPLLYKWIVKKVNKERVGINMTEFLLPIYKTVFKLKIASVVQYNKFLALVKRPPVVKNTDETLNKIVTNKVSVSRYGDGEFAIMNGKSLLFQDYSKELASKLKEIVKSNKENHIVCIPDVFNDLIRFRDYAKNYWTNYLNHNRYKIYKHLEMKKPYYDAFITRLYADLKNRQLSEERFNKVRKLWESRDVLIVEGAQSRLGIGNDLFNNTKSIKRIICPAKNAFESYKEILNEVKLHEKATLILIALGPTATVLSYDLALLGYQAVDIGHIDIEYEWYLHKVEEKAPVKHKYIGEVKNGTNVEDIQDERYEREVIKKII